MNGFSLAQIKKSVYQSSLNALEESYQGALAIKKIEDTHFGGGAITEQENIGKTVSDYFKTQLERQLLKIRSNLLKFRMTNFVVNPETNVEETNRDSYKSSTEISINEEAIILEKLNFIDSVVSKYRDLNKSSANFFGKMFSDQTPSLTPEVLQPEEKDLPRKQPPLADQDAGISPPILSPEIISSKTIGGKLNKQPEPSRLFGGVERIRKEFNPKYEQEVVQELRKVRSQNRIAVRWLLLLLFVPLIIQFFTKNLILNPTFGNYFDRHPTRVELSEEIREEFIHEFSLFKEALEIQRLIRQAIREREEKEGNSLDNKDKKGAEVIYQSRGAQNLLTPIQWREIEQKNEEELLQEKVIELWREARQRQLQGFKNVLADGLALIAFGAIVFFNRDRLAVIRRFSHRTFLSLNDPSKVFLFILVTDMFVGFHSAEGWEVILEGISHHFGLPENAVFIRSFIATVPVIADSCIKFWLFNYLTRYSPSASAIYERMNT